MSDAIGGYFELEISNRGTIYHDKALALNTCRNAFEHVLFCNQIKHIYIPYFTCDVILEPLKKLKVLYTFYHIDEFFYPCLPNLSSTDTILYNNYFGLCNNNIKKLSTVTRNLIIDNAQAFYDLPILNFPTIYSPRKFFGLPDGGFVYNSNENSHFKYAQDNSENRFSHLLIRVEHNAEDGYLAFIENEEKLSHQPTKLMSNLTRKLLNGIDFEFVKHTRIENFKMFHFALRNQNKLTQFINKAKYTCPFVYPFWIKNGNSLRNKLIKNRVYTPQYWPNVINWVEMETFEFYFTNDVVYLPIDQRISSKTIQNLLNIINN